MNEEVLNVNRSKEIIFLIRKGLYLFIKRFFDILFGLIGLIIILPIALAVKISYLLTGDKNPIIFKHKRIGKNGKEFGMYKFRTMVPNAEKILKKLLKNKRIKQEWMENHKLDNDPRITKVGNILRKTSLDEIPQLINVLKGDMSLIGPRPLVQDEVDAYGSNKDKLLSMKPGLTGWWACNGRSCTTTKKRQELELFYIDNCSIILDIKCIFLTAIKVLKREGAK